MKPSCREQLTNKKIGPMALTQNSGKLIRKEAVERYQSVGSEGQRNGHQQGKEQRSHCLPCPKSGN